MPYLTVFEITHEAIPLWIPFFFLIFGLIGTVILVDTRNLGFITKLVRCFVSLFVCVWLVFTAYYFLDRRHYVRAYKDGKYRVVEGLVENYSWKGKTECFSVGAVKACHGTANQVGWDPPFRLGPSTWPVGLIRDGMPVRIVFPDGQIAQGASSFPKILRLDIAP